MNKIDKQWQLVKDYNHSIIRTHWGGSDEPPREVDSREEPEDFGSSSLNHWSEHHKIMGQMFHKIKES